MGGSLGLTMPQQTMLCQHGAKDARRLCACSRQLTIGIRCQAYERDRDTLHSSHLHTCVSAQVGAGECWHKKSTFKQHLLETYKIAKLWGLDSALCDTMLFHRCMLGPGDLPSNCIAGGSWLAKSSKGWAGVTCRGRGTLRSACRLGLAAGVTAAGGC